MSEIVSDTEKIVRLVVEATDRMVLNWEVSEKLGGFVAYLSSEKTSYRLFQMIDLRVDRVDLGIRPDGDDETIITGDELAVLFKNIRKSLDKKEKDLTHLIEPLARALLAKR